MCGHQLGRIDMSIRRMWPRSKGCTVYYNRTTCETRLAKPQGCVLMQAMRSLETMKRPSRRLQGRCRRTLRDQNTGKPRCSLGARFFMKKRDCPSRDVNVKFTKKRSTEMVQLTRDVNSSNV